ncbi:MAG TPA: TRAP transporter small permease [Alphaproteobacteria bacterium]|nr:TRAP transporter small permease [Alphaproteobacteria bacterium]
MGDHAHPAPRRRSSLQRLGAFYDGLLKAMMALAAIYVLAIMAAIILTVTARRLGIPYPGQAFSFIEYGVLYVLMLGAPWLVRRRAHILIELVTAVLPARARRIYSRGVAALAALICAILAWYGGGLALNDYLDGTVDVRVGDFDRWMVMIAMPIGFALMATEFLRFVFGAQSLHTGEAGLNE